MSAFGTLPCSRRSRPTRRGISISPSLLYLPTTSLIISLPALLYLARLFRLYLEFDAQGVFTILVWRARYGYYRLRLSLPVLEEEEDLEEEETWPFDSL